MNSKRKEVIEKILEKIHSGEIVANGKLLPERQLAESIGESRPVLREGLVALEAMGVLDIRERQGIYFSSREENGAKMVLQKVRGWPADILSQVMEVRQIIEPLAAGLAAARRNDKDLMKMRECLEYMSALVNQSGEEAAKKGAHYNTILHVLIVESANNLYFSRIYEGIYAVIEDELSLMRVNTSPEASGGRELAYQEHVRLYKSIEARDSVGAELSAEEHLLHTVNAMVQLGQIVPTSNLIGQNLVGRARSLQKLI